MFLQTSVRNLILAVYVLKDWVFSADSAPIRFVGRWDKWIVTIL